MHLLLLLTVAAVTLTAQNLRIYAIDVEGGKSTLYVAPSGESMLIDAGYGSNNNRDANRIVAAAAAARVKRIDLLVVTHYHADHAGGVPQLAAKLPIGKIYDYGDPPEQGKAKAVAVFEPYKKIRSKLPHTILKPGDSIPFKGLKVTVVAGDLAAAVDKANADGADFIFIDTPPALLTRIEAAVAIADLVLVPSQATALDVEAVGATCDIARKYNRPFVFVLNRIEARSKRNAEAEAYLKVDGQVLASRIGNRESYAAAVTTGRSGPELRDLTAKAEIDALWAEVRRLLGARTRGTVRA